MSLLLDANDQPHIAFGKQRSINYATNSVSGWDIATLASSDTDLYNGLVELQLNSLDQPTIVFFNAANLVRLATPQQPGDVNRDDFLEWQRGNSPSTADLIEWQTHYGEPDPLGASSANVPEPSAAWLLLCGLATLSYVGSRR